MAGRLAAIERVVLSAPGVLGLDIDLVNGTVAIDYDEDTLDVQRLHKLLIAIRRATPTQRRHVRGFPA